jgi:hypothetical protein
MSSYVEKVITVKFQYDYYQFYDVYFLKMCAKLNDTHDK